MLAVLHGIFGALIGGIAGAILFFLVTTTLYFGNNLGGLVGLMVAPVGLIV